MDKTALNAINKFFYFSMNFPYDFIEKVWGDEPWLVNHLKGKFNGLYDSDGSYGVINAFYGELSTSNRIKLMDWVMNNYSDEIKLSFNE